MADYIRKEQKTYGGYYYYYKCEKCGNEFFRSRCGKNIIPICGACAKKRNAEKQRARNRQREADLVNAVLDKIRTEIDEYEDTDPIKAKYIRQIIDRYRNEEMTEYYERLKTITNKAYTWFCPNCGTKLIMVQKEGD